MRQRRPRRDWHDNYEPAARARPSMRERCDGGGAPTSPAPAPAHGGGGDGAGLTLGLTAGRSTMNRPAADCCSLRCSRCSGVATGGKRKCRKSYPRAFHAASRHPLTDGEGRGGDGGMSQTSSRECGEANEKY